MLEWKNEEKYKRHGHNNAVIITMFPQFYLASHTDGFVQDDIHFANALEILQSCTKPSIYVIHERDTERYEHTRINKLQS